MDLVFLRKFKGETGKITFISIRKLLCLFREMEKKKKDFISDR